VEQHSEWLDKVIAEDPEEVARLREAVAWEEEPGAFVARMRQLAAAQLASPRYAVSEVRRLFGVKTDEQAEELRRAAARRGVRIYEVPDGNQLRLVAVEVDGTPACSCGRSGFWSDGVVHGTCAHQVEALRLHRAWLEAVVSEDAAALDALAAEAAQLWGNERPRRRSFIDPSPERFAEDVATIAERQLAVVVLHAFVRALEDDANLGRPLDAILAESVWRRTRSARPCAKRCRSVRPRSPRSCRSSARRVGPKCSFSCRIPVYRRCESHAACPK